MGKRSKRKARARRQRRLADRFEGWTIPKRLPSLNKDLNGAESELTHGFWDWLFKGVK
jgi:hypothetical protein